MGYYRNAFEEIEAASVIFDMTSNHDRDDAAPLLARGPVRVPAVSGHQATIYHPYPTPTATIRPRPAAAARLREFVTLDCEEKSRNTGLTPGIAALSVDSSSPIQASGNPTTSRAAAQTTPSSPARHSAAVYFSALQTDMILYLGLRACTKGAIAFALRSSREDSGKGRSVEKWEAAAQLAIKAALVGVAEKGDVEKDVNGFLSRVLNHAGDGNWRNTIFVVAGDYQEAVNAGKNRGEVRAHVQYKARNRVKRQKHKARIADSSIDTSNVGPVAAKGMQDGYEHDQVLTLGDLDYNFLLSEWGMGDRLAELLGSSMICGQALADW